MVTLGPLETSALALSLRGWTGGSDDANAYVAAVDRGYVLFGAHGGWAHETLYAVGDDEPEGQADVALGYSLMDKTK